VPQVQQVGVSLSPEEQEEITLQGVQQPLLQALRQVIPSGGNIIIEPSTLNGSGTINGG